MEMHERIRELRKTYLKMSQSAFGERLGVSRDVIKNIELNALARPEQKLSLIKLMCKEFSVSEDWILNGNEPMFVESDSFSLDEFAKQRGATELELEAMKAYFELDPDIRKMLVQHFKERLTHESESENKCMTEEDARNLYDSVPDTPEEFERLYPSSPYPPTRRNNAV